MPDAEAIAEALGADRRAAIDRVEEFDEIDSTNAWLLQQAAPPPGRFRIAAARHQTAGRGRMDRPWVSPPGAGLCLSLSYTTVLPPERLAGLTLAIGVSVARALTTLGVMGAGLKWPNDLMLRDRKLGGILTETKAAGSVGTTIVAGIGVNVNFGNGGAPPGIGQVIDLASCMPEPPGMDLFAGTVAGDVIDGVNRFDANGLGPFQDDWTRLDWLRGQMVVIEQDGGALSGVCQGIDADGALLLQSAGETRRVLSGSVRPATPGERMG